MTGGIDRTEQVDDVEAAQGLLQRTPRCDKWGNPHLWLHRSGNPTILGLLLSVSFKEVLAYVRGHSLPDGRRMDPLRLQGGGCDCCCGLLLTRETMRASGTPPFQSPLNRCNVSHYCACNEFSMSLTLGTSLQDSGSLEVRLKVNTLRACGSVI